MVPQVLVCDDEVHILRAISLKFMRADLEVKGTTDIESCWRWLQHHETPTVLIVDESVPSEDATADLLGRVRSESRLANLPVILLASKPPCENLQDFEFTRIVMKPFSPRELLATVQEILGRNSQLATSNCHGRREMACGV